MRLRRRWHHWWFGFRHHRRMKRLYAQFMRAGDLVFDVGANLGNRTRVFTELGAQVIAVEPQRECVRQLYMQFHANPHVTIIPRALGAAPGQMEMQIGNWNQVSSLNPRYVRAISQLKEFPQLQWAETRSVRTTTLDALIEQYGMPAFVKVDVEGFEAEVFKGLTQPIPACSFEFVTQYPESAEQSIARLEQFGAARYNYAVLEQMKLLLDEWVSADEILRILRSHEKGGFLSGDVYARLAERRL